jgi:hypothetical protein
MNEAPHESLISRINDILATRITMLVGSIWAFYAFMIFGLTPILWPQYETEILYWSNFLQLIFLPIITVGTAILSRNSERRAAEDHRTIRREFALLQDAHEMLHKSLQEIAAGVHELLLRAGQDDAATPKEASSPVKKTAES